jgi:hypothetical protein
MLVILNLPASCQSRSEVPAAGNPYRFGWTIPSISDFLSVLLLRLFRHWLASLPVACGQSIFYTVVFPAGFQNGAILYGFMAFWPECGYNCTKETAGAVWMFDKAKTVMQDYLKAFGVDPLPPIVETPGKGVAFQPDENGTAITIGSATDVEKVPLAEWMIAAGMALMRQNGSNVAPLYFGPESEEGETNRRVADDLYYVADLAAIYQCYLRNPVEAYCIYDDAIAKNDEASLHPLAVALGLSHPRGLEAMGFDRQKHGEVFEEADFFKPVITQKRPDLSLLVALQNAWQKQLGVNVRISVEASVLRFAKRA